MAIKGKPIKESLFYETTRNWLCDIASDVAMDAWREHDEASWRDAIWHCQHNATSARAGIIVGAQALDTLVRMVPFDKIPVIKEVSEPLYEWLGEGLEQSPDAVLKYANKQRIDFPEGYKPKNLDPVQLFKSFADWLKGAAGGLIGKLEEKIRERFPQVEALLSGLFKKVGVGDKPGRYQHLHQLRMRRPDLVKPWLEFVAKLPEDVEDDFQRIDQPLCEEGVIESILELPEAEGIALIRRLATDTFGEKVGAVVSGIAEVARPLHDSWERALDRTDKAREQRQQAQKAERERARRKFARLQAQRKR